MLSKIPALSCGDAEDKERNGLLFAGGLILAAPRFATFLFSFLLPLLVRVVPRLIKIGKKSVAGFNATLAS
jgi:hypothetical protein